MEKDEQGRQERQPVFTCDSVAADGVYRTTMNAALDCPEEQMRDTTDTQQMRLNGLTPDLSWKEITANIQRLKQVNANRPTAVSDTYLEEILQVNAALQGGRTISIRVAGHGFTCLPGELLPRGEHASEGCLLLLKKVMVEFRQAPQKLIYRITLQFWDTTHKQEVAWGAITVQPQWKTIVQQALNQAT